MHTVSSYSILFYLEEMDTLQIYVHMCRERMAFWYSTNKFIHEATAIIHSLNMKFLQ